MAGMIKRMSVSAAPWLDGVVSQSTILDNEGGSRFNIYTHASRS